MNEDLLNAILGLGDELRGLVQGKYQELNLADAVAALAKAGGDIAVAIHDVADAIRECKR